MNENLNLRKILDGREGAEFYSPICGDCIFMGFDGKEGEVKFPLIIRSATKASYYYLRKNGKMEEDGELIIFPSKDQMDWNKIDIPSIGDYVFVSDDGTNWCIRIYNGGNKALCDNEEIGTSCSWKYIVKTKEFDLNDIESNKLKSFV